PSRSRGLTKGGLMKFTRTRYKQGCLKKEKRNSGANVWIFRWRELDADGKRVNRKRIVGTVEEYRTESAAKKAAAALRMDINKEARTGAVARFAELADALRRWKKVTLFNTPE